VKAVENFFNKVGGIIDAIAGLPPGELRNEIGLVVLVLASFGALKASNAPLLADEVTAIVLGISAIGIAVERIAAVLRSKK
jgi:hypothetical protein